MWAIEGTVKSFLLAGSGPFSARSHTTMLVRLATLVVAALALNVHYVLLGRPFLEGPLTSRPVLAAGNSAFGKLIRLSMNKQGVPQADRTETYSNGAASGRVDVYEPEDGSAVPGEPRTAVLYFHCECSQVSTYTSLVTRPSLATH